MEYSPFEIPSPTESVDVELTHEDMIEGGTTTEPGIVQRVSSLARQALSQVRSTTRRVRAETERLVEGVRRRIPWSGPGLQTEAGRLLAKLEDRVVRLHKDFQELERIHHILHVGTEPLQEVQDLQRRIADMEKRLGDARCQATGEERS